MRAVAGRPNTSRGCWAMIDMACAAVFWVLIYFMCVRNQ
jgi:hypothetical protein